MTQQNLTALILNAKFRLQRDNHPHKEGLLSSITKWEKERMELRWTDINNKGKRKK